MDDSNFDGVRQGIQEQPLANLWKPMIFARVESNMTLTCRRFNELAHRRCIGPTVMLCLPVGWTNWLTAGVYILVSDLHKKFLTTLTPTKSSEMFRLTDATLTELFRIFRAFWSCSLVYTGSSAIAFDSHFRQTGCPRTSIRLFCCFGDYETLKLYVSESAKWLNRGRRNSETLYSSIGSSGTFSDAGRQRFSDKIIVSVEPQALQVILWCIRPTMMPWLAVALTNWIFLNSIVIQFVTGLGYAGWLIIFTVHSPGTST